MGLGSFGWWFVTVVVVAFQLGTVKTQQYGNASNIYQVTTDGLTFKSNIGGLYGKTVTCTMQPLQYSLIWGEDSIDCNNKKYMLVQKNMKSKECLGLVSWSQQPITSAELTIGSNQQFPNQIRDFISNIGSFDYNGPVTTDCDSSTIFLEFLCDDPDSTIMNFGYTQSQIQNANTSQTSCTWSFSVNTQYACASYK
eukprot:142463_1